MNSEQALSELKAAQASRKGAGDYYTQYQNELGVGQAQSRANDIRGLIRNAETTLKGVGQAVAGRTRGQGVNEAQRARLEQLERRPVAEELGGLQGSYSDEMQNYRDLLGQATTRSGMAYQTDADKLSALESNYSKIFQSEQAAAEAARWERQQAESARQFNEQMAQAQRQLAATDAASKRNMAQAASFRQGDQDAANAAAADRKSREQAAVKSQLQRQFDEAEKRRKAAASNEFLNYSSNLSGLSNYLGGQLNNVLGSIGGFFR